MTYNGLLITRYYMRFPSEEEKQQKIITTILCDIKGCHKDNFEHIVHFENVKIIAQFPNPETYTDYKTADIAFDDNAFDDVDEDMIEAVKREICMTETVLLILLLITLAEVIKYIKK